MLRGPFITKYFETQLITFGSKGVNRIFKSR